MATSLERMTACLPADEVGEWLKEHGFSEDTVDAFERQCLFVDTFKAG